MTKTVSFHRMQDGTRDDYLLLDQQERDFARTLPDRILAALRSLEQSLGGYQVSRLEHCLQTATRALNDGADEELLTAALIHDIGDELAPYNHAEVAAGVIRPYGTCRGYVDRGTARPVSNLLLRAPHGRQPQCARALA